MTDRREMILDRIEELAKGINGVKLAERYRLVLPDKNRPAIIITNGDEQVAETLGGSGRHDPAAPTVYQMMPEVNVFVSEDRKRIGPELATMRNAIIKAVLTDPILRGPDYAYRQMIQYRGLQTGVALDPHVAADLRMMFVIFYMLDPSAL
jgi:hypothetical protein